MSYRIHYQTTGKKEIGEKNRFRRTAMMVLCFYLFLVMVSNFWPEAAKLAKDTLFTLRPAVVVSAMDEIAKEFQEGITFSEVIENMVQNLYQEDRFASG